MPRSFLQTTQWADFQRSLGNATWQYDADGISASIVQSGLPLGKNYLYIPYGPEIDFNALTGGIKRSVEKFFTYVRDLAHRERAVFVRIEPMSDTVAEVLYPHGLRVSSRTVQPHRTLVVNLEGDEYELLGAMHHKMRYNIGLAEKKNLTFEESDNVGTFYELLEKTSARDGFVSYSKHYFEKLLGTFERREGIHVRMFIARHGSTPVAGAVILVDGTRAYYLHGASDHAHRALMGPHFLHWNIMKMLRASGCTQYDLWGIDATRWPGVTRFKLGFGGRTTEYPGAFDLPISKFWYFAYTVLRKLR